MQVEALGKHPHIVVATPGRLLDLVDDEAAPLVLGEWLCLPPATGLLTIVPFHSSIAPYNSLYTQRQSLSPSKVLSLQTLGLGTALVA